MMTQSTVTRFILTPLLFWVVLLAAGSYFMISFDMKSYKEAQKEKTTLGYLKKTFKSLRLTNINKGIDLAGGTHLILSVEVEKALENRLNLENRSLDQLFKEKELRALPKTRAVKNMSIEIMFDDEEHAKSCYNLMVDERAYVLKVNRSGAFVRAKLTPETENNIRVGAVEQAVSVLNNRLTGYGAEGIIVQQHGERKIVVQLPGVNDPDRVKKLITKTAHLEFKIVEDIAASKEALLDKFDGDLPADKVIIPGSRRRGDTGQYFLLSAFSDMTGDRIVDARVSFDEFGRPYVGFRLDGAGAREFGDLTSNNVGRQLGIVIDNVMFSYPSIKDPITGGSGSITNIATQKEALDLSIVLKSGSLLAPLKFEQESRVGASLGQDSINKGLMSCLVALFMLLFFSLFYYKVPGLFAVFALFYNLFLIMLFLSYFNATLTLPGIAGMVVTVGMAIDASILIYERIKEELAEGASARAAVNKGFSGAMVVILDSNITTFLTGLVLYQFGGPAIKGFAVTLMAGIIATILAGVYFLKSIYSFAFDFFKMKTIRF